MSSTAGDEGRGGRFGVKGVRTCGLLLAAIFIIYFLLTSPRFDESPVAAFE